MHVSRSIALFVTRHCPVFCWRWCRDICRNALKLPQNKLHAAAIYVHPWHCRSRWATDNMWWAWLSLVTRTFHGKFNAPDQDRLLIWVVQNMQSRWCWNAMCTFMLCPQDNCNTYYDKTRRLPLNFARSNTVLTWQMFPIDLHTLCSAMKSACVVLHSTICLRLCITTLF